MSRFSFGIVIVPQMTFYQRVFAITILAKDYIGYEKLKTSGRLLHELWKTRFGLTLWSPVTHICVNKLTTIGSDNGRRQATIWPNVGIVLIGPLRTNFSEILTEIHIFLFQENAFENVVWKMAAIFSRPQCVTVNFQRTAYISTALRLKYDAFTMTSHGCQGVENHRQLNFLFSNLFSPGNNMISKYRITGICEGNVRGIHPWPLVSPHKEPIMWKAFALHEVNMHWGPFSTGKWRYTYMIFERLRLCNNGC